MSSTATPTEKDAPSTERADRSEQEEAVIAASRTANPSQELSEAQVKSATDWFLSEDQEPPTILEFDVNVAAAGLPANYIRWGVRSLTRNEIKVVRRDSEQENGLIDDMDMNLRIVVEASTNPDLKQIAAQQGLADPADILLKRFAHRPGIIEAIARKANEMSGYGNVELIRPVDAAGN